MITIKLSFIFSHKIRLGSCSIAHKNTACLSLAFVRHYGRIPFFVPHYIMKSTKVQTLGANTICACDWSWAGKKMAKTTTATGAVRYIATSW